MKFQEEISEESKILKRMIKPNKNNGKPNKTPKYSHNSESRLENKRKKKIKN